MARLAHSRASSPNDSWVHEPGEHRTDLFELAFIGRRYLIRSLKNSGSRDRTRPHRPCRTTKLMKIPAFNLQRVDVKIGDENIPDLHGSPLP
jgi:hypothetical protein